MSVDYRSSALALTLIASVALAQADRPQTAGKPVRVVAAGEWQMLRQIGLDSDLFEQPFAMAATVDRVVVVDGGSNSVQSFRITGEREWKVGRRGRGPGEYLNPVDVTLDGAGNALIYDPDNARLTVLDRAGRVTGMTPLGQRTDRAVFGDRAGIYLLLNTASDSFAIMVDTAGARRGPIVPLPRELRATLPIGREMSAVLPVTDGYQVAFRWSSRMTLIDRTGAVRKSCTGIDSLSFPLVKQTKLNIKLGRYRNLRTSRVDPRARQAATSVTVLGANVAVSAPPAPGKARLIDFYSLECGRYLGSRPFPFVASHVAGSGDLLVAMLVEPVPHLAVLRWKPK
jgi:hypothetical protein